MISCPRFLSRSFLGFLFLVVTALPGVSAQAEPIRKSNGFSHEVTTPPAEGPKGSARVLLAGGGVLLLLWLRRGRGRDSGIGL